MKFKIKALPAVTGSVMPDFVGEVATEESPYPLSPDIFAIKEPAKGEVVSPTICHELL